MSWDDILFDQTSLSDVEKVAYAPKKHRVPVRMSRELRNDLERPLPAHRDPQVAYLTENVVGNRMALQAARHIDRAIIAARKTRLEKTAGLFMKPSDIADHTNLANELENRLNGASPEPQFKAASKTRMLTGAAIGAVAGSMAHFNAKNSPVPAELAPQEVQGVRGKIRKSLNKSSRGHANFAKESPTASLLTHAAIGGATGALVGSDSIKKVKDMFRRS